MKKIKRTKKTRQQKLDAAFGLWKNRNDDYHFQSIRNSWERKF